MAGRGEDRAQGFAAQSIKGSAAHLSQSSPDHQEQGDHTPRNHSLTGNDQRESAGQAGGDRPKPKAATNRKG